MTDVKRICKRCLLLESGKADIKKEVEKLIAELPSWKKPSPSEYDERLELCRECPFLTGGTCLKCGCYVEYRAAQKYKSCPISRWKDINKE